VYATKGWKFALFSNIFWGFDFFLPEAESVPARLSSRVDIHLIVEWLVLEKIWEKKVQILKNNRPFA